MTTKTYAEIIRSADEMPAGLFAARWRLMPEAESIPGIDPAEATALVRSALRTSDLPGHMLPKRVHVLEQLPLRGIGKVDRAAARRLAEQ